MKPQDFIPRYAENLEDYMLYCSEQIYVLCYDQKKKNNNQFNHLKSRCFEMIEKKYSKPYNTLL